MVVCPQKKTIDESDLQAQYGQTWVWAAIESATRLIVCYLVGDRTLESCREFLTELSSRVDNIPLFTSDELPHYKTILSEIYSEEIPVEKTGKRGRPQKPVKIVDPELDYATVHKTREKGNSENSRPGCQIDRKKLDIRNGLQKTIHKITINQ